MFFFMLPMLVDYRPIEIKEIHVELIEMNTVTNNSDDGIRFIQIVAWDKMQDENNRWVPVDRGYKVQKDGYPAIQFDGEYYTVRWFSTGFHRLYILKTKEILVTETPYDREAIFRHYGGWYKPIW